MVVGGGDSFFAAVVVVDVSAASVGEMVDEVVLLVCRRRVVS